MKWYHKDAHPATLVVAGVVVLAFLIGLYFLASAATENMARRRIELINACDDGQRSACARLSSEY